MQTCFERSEPLLDVGSLRRLWADLRALPRSPGGDVMTDGDLIPGTMLVADGRLAGVIDVGGLRPADPALDLVAAWHLLEPQPRRTLRCALQCDDLQWARGDGPAHSRANLAGDRRRRREPAADHGCLELLRCPHDHCTTRFAFVLVGGNGTWRVLACIPSYHALYARADPDLISLVDDLFAHGNLCNWAAFTDSALRLSRDVDRSDLDERLTLNVFALHGGANR